MLVTWIWNAPDLIDRAKNGSTDAIAFKIADLTPTPEKGSNPSDIDMRENLIVKSLIAKFETPLSLLY